MKVFISWSGEQSRAIGEVLRDWIPSVLQAAKPYFSPEDVSKGARWNSEISAELESSQVGLLLLTRENQHAPWLVFEAGALAKNLDKARVCPLLFGDLKPSDVTGPLSGFQGAPFSKEEMKRVAKMINSQLGENALESPVFDTVFDKWWPDLETGVQKALHDHSANKVQRARPEREILDEMLSLVRKLSEDRDRTGVHREAQLQQVNLKLAEDNSRKLVVLANLNEALGELIGSLASTGMLSGKSPRARRLLHLLRESMAEASELVAKKNPAVATLSALIREGEEETARPKTRKTELDDDIPF